MSRSGRGLLTGRRLQNGRVNDGAVHRFMYSTPRLLVEPWHEAAERLGLNLADEVARLLTARTTAALPENWRGDFSAERARAWITERDGESPTLLATEFESAATAGLVILGEVPLAPSTDNTTGIDLRIGYVIAESMWGRGLATELLAGLVAWARTQPSIQTITGGVESGNRASIRVLDKVGFRHLDTNDDDMLTFQIDLGRQ